ncbi:MAG: YceI family protein, partial [Steroidobacteraceae bacterium]
MRGRPFEVVSAESRLTVLVYRAGALAALGHNHVVSCRCLSGIVYLPRDPLRAGFDLRVAVSGLTVDDPGLRAAEHSRDFPSEGSASAREGTRHNMLSAALLNAVAYPRITLRSEGLRPSADGKRGDVVAQVLVRVAGQERSIAVPMHYDIRADAVVATGEFPLKLTDLGLAPFSAAGGALKVKDEMTVRLSLI